MEYKENATGQLEPMVEYTSDPHERELMKKPIGHYGTLWQNWIVNNHSFIVKDRYVRHCRWAIVPRLVDEMAEKRYKELDEIYRKTNPEPDGEDTMESIRYHEKRKGYIENCILEEIVYVRWEEMDWR